MKNNNQQIEQILARHRQHKHFVDFEAMKTQNQAIEEFLAGKEVSPHVATSMEQNKLGKNLIHYREHKGLSLQEAQRITGVALDQYEQGTAVPKLEEIFKISSLYGVQPHHIIARVAKETIVPASCYGLLGNKNWYTIGTLLELYHSGIADKNPFFKNDMGGVINSMEESIVEEEIAV